MIKVINIIIPMIILVALIRCSEDFRKPILVLATNSDFGTYTGEILKAEGYNEFQMDSLMDAKITLKYLKQFDIVILTESKIKYQVKLLLQEYVKNGGFLIAFRPDTELGELFGIKTTGEGLAEGYIGIDITTKQGKGLTGKTMQFHGIADKYIFNTGRIIAKLYDGPFNETDFPAVICNSYGKGQTVAFAYNLPKSIIYTRQGNPLKTGKETDCIPGIRAMDMFTGSWINTSKNTLNQADEQMRLLTHCIETMGKSLKPLPRFWYFPDTLQCLVTLTNDGEYRSEFDFENQFRDIDSMGAKMSIYILETDKVAKDWTDKWANKGFEISGHPDDTDEASDPHWNNMYNVLISKKKEIADIYGLSMKTIVNHWFVWCAKDSAGKPEFAAQAELEAQIGLGMDVNYAHYDNSSNQGHFLGPLGINQGNFTGSGLAMKFATGKGKILNLYQHLNNVYDQQYMENHDAEGYYNSFKGLMDRSLYEGVYSFISIKAHNDEYYFSREPLLKMLVYANAKNVPVWTVAKLLDFIRMKDEASFSDIKWSNNQLTFKLVSNIKNPNGLTFMLPVYHDNTKIKSINIDGKSGQFKFRTIKGHEYALVTVIPGNMYEISINYS